MMPCTFVSNTPRTLQAGGEKSEVKYAEFDHQSLTVLHAHSWTQIQRVTPREKILFYVPETHIM